MSADEVRATVWQLFESGPGRSVLTLWEEMARDLCTASPEQYLPHPTARYALLLLQTAQVSVDRSLIGYRTLEVCILTQAGAPTLIEASLGNLFALMTDASHQPIRTADYPLHATWLRRTGMVALDEHVRLVSQAIEDWADAGWWFLPARLEQLSVPLPQVRNAVEARVFTGKDMRQLARYPLASPNEKWGLRVLHPDHGVAEAAAKAVVAGFGRLFQDERARPATVSYGGDPSHAEVSVVVLYHFAIKR